MSSSVEASERRDAARERQAAFAAAGLPVPVFDGKRTPTHESLMFDAKIGVFVHRVLGELAPTLGSMARRDALAAIGETVDRVVTGRGLGRAGSVRLRVIAMVVAYMDRYLPPVGAEFLATELVCGDGRVDLAWRLPGVGVWFDEIKTWRHQDVGLDRVTWEQIHRYMAAGRGEFGAEFAGLRVLVLSQTAHASVAVDVFGTVEPLQGSALHPSRLVARRAA